MSVLFSIIEKMKEIEVKDGKPELLALIDKSKSEPILIRIEGLTEAVLISFEQYQGFLEAMEELDDIAVAEKSLRESGPNIPWDDVKKDLGLS